MMAALQDIKCNNVDIKHDSSPFAFQAVL
ncbi:hypothetical protein PM8797T_09489 [Gimesia maris DSM 8797]|nr:hypothetical protein PM8797T_09489 [Gimesia maris DSM 8797]